MDDPGGLRSYLISREMARRGHHVTMITSVRKSHPKAERVDVDGIDVVYVKNPYYSNYLPVWRKIWSFISFVWNGSRAALKERDVSLVFATSTPLSVGAIALWLKWRRRCRYVFEVRDLWPEFPIEVGVVKSRLAIWGLRRFERSIYNKAEHIIALSPGMKEGITNTGVLSDRVSTIPNMSMTDRFYPHEPDCGTIKEFGIDMTKFNVVYFGSMGFANGLLYLIEAAKCLKEEGDNTVQFVLLGGGATEPSLKKKAKDYGLENVLFLGSQKNEVVVEVVNCCDISIVTFLNLPVLSTNSPNKFFDSLAAGKPCIVNSDGWTKNIVEENKCGCYVDPEKPERLSDKLLEIKDDKDLLTCWGHNARQVALRSFDKDMLSAKVADILEKYGS